jgi:hypothetical protein
MAKNKISEWSSTPSNNTDIGGIDIAEGCAPSGINNGIRELMAQVKDMITGADGDNLTVGGNLTVNGTTTLTGDATAPTQLTSDNSTKIATTAYVKAITGTLGTMSSQNTDSATMTGNSTIDGVLLGYRSIPQDAQSSGYTLVLADNGKHVYYTGAAATITVPTNASVAFPTGSTVTIINNGSGALTIGTSGLTVYFAGTSSTGNRTLNTKGMATLIKVATDTWFISGVGLA